VIASVSQLFGGHFWHVVTFASWAPLFAAVLGVERWRARRAHAAVPRPPRASRRRLGGPAARQLFAIGLVAAATVHLFVMPAHFAQSALYGSFFLGAAALQLGGAALVLGRPSRAVIDAASAACALIVAIWVVSRLVGVPVGPDHGATEPIGVLDVLATASECLALGAGLVARHDLAPGARWRWRDWAPGVRVMGASWLAVTLVAGVLAAKS